MRTIRLQGRADASPPLSLVAWEDTVRLIPAQYDALDRDVLDRVAPAHGRLNNVRDLVDLTDDGAIADLNLAPGISPHELVVGVPYANVINAAFVYPSPQGSRFGVPDRGVWYASRKVETSLAEVQFHKVAALSEVGRFEDETTYIEYLADFHSKFHDLRSPHKFKACLDPVSYVTSQKLAEHLLESGSLGIVYPSVRHRRGQCVACFRPALVTNVRRRAGYRLSWNGRWTPSIKRLPS